ncbi:PIG-L family deacetylase [Paeniglutamicibacter antarcticus]|uniref:PIG-L family deacetylase n=1 Tax=Arthrobacter terrae TaxID=2935737 RepID=A0A931CUZ5_9MICC|nr:PIG-L family deacetylase [Arthrobacter terrae]MBG0740348.1 PIG-L family deacetylase [Arthrobacter terrae]
MTPQQPVPESSRGGLLPLTQSAGQRLLFVHAHPDDETLVTGATMALYRAAGAEVALLTCTRGELGEVIPVDLQHFQVRQQGDDDGGSTDGAQRAAGGGNLDSGGLRAAADGLADRGNIGAGLAAVRELELAAALEELGVQQLFWLGRGLAKAGPGPDAVYRDSGMSWGPDGRARAAATVLPGSLSRAPLDEVANHAAQLIRSLRPHAVITYAADGGYGHPDHIRAHELTVRAVQLAGLEVPPTVYTIVSDRPERPLDQDAALITVHGNFEAKRAAMRAHRTQVSVEGNRYALSDGVWKDISATETFQVLHQSAAPAGIRPATSEGESQRLVIGEPAHSGLIQPAQPAPSRLAGAVATIGLGVLAGLLGTALHGHALATAGPVLPWGSALALLLLLSLTLFVGLWRRSAWLSAISGFFAYVVAGILSIPRGDYGLIIGDVQGNVWLYGIAVVTPLSAVVCVYLLRRQSQRAGSPSNLLRRKSSARPGV